MIQDIYMKLSDNSDIEEVKKKILKDFEKYEKIRYIFDITQGSVSIKSMKELKIFFDNNKELVEKKLEETCIVLEGSVKKRIITFFLNSVKKIRPVRII